MTNPTEFCDHSIIALNLLCRGFIQMDDNELFADFHTSWLDDLEIIDRFLYEQPPPLQLPFDFNAEELMIGYISPQRAKKILHILKQIDLSSTNCTEQIDAVIDGTFDKNSIKGQETADPEIMEGREIFIEWLKKCVEKNLSLLTFTS